MPYFFNNMPQSSG